VHLACHGKQTGDPMKSGLLLLQDKILEPSEIAKHALSRADFPFLQFRVTDCSGGREDCKRVGPCRGWHVYGKCDSYDVVHQGYKDAPQTAEDVYKRILKDGRPNREGGVYTIWYV